MACQWGIGLDPYSRNEPSLTHIPKRLTNGNAVMKRESTDFFAWKVGNSTQQPLTALITLEFMCMISVLHSIIQPTCYRPSLLSPYAPLCIKVSLASHQDLSL